MKMTMVNSRLFNTASDNFHFVTLVTLIYTSHIFHTQTPEIYQWTIVFSPEKRDSVIPNLR